MSASRPPTDVKPCSFFLQGHCKFGGRCKFLHESTTQASNAQAPGDAQTQSRASTKHSQRARWSDKSGNHVPVNSANHGSSDRSQRKSIPCRAWKSGTCAQGDRCKFGHDPQVQEAERVSKAAMAATEAEAQKKIQVANAENSRRAQMAEQAEKGRRDAAQKVALAEEEAAREAQQAEREAARQAKLADQEAARRAQQAQREIRRVELAKKEAAMTVKHNVLGSIVTFGAGLAIQNIITGFESCHIRVKNLPLDAKPNEVHDLFAQQGLDPARFHVLGMRKTPDGKQEATIMSDAEIGNMMAIGLDEIEFRQEKLLFEVTKNDTVEGMGASAGNSEVLTVTWHAPSISFVAEYADLSQAEDKVKQLDRKICGGRRVKVEMNRSPPGRIMMHFNPNSVKIMGLPLSITEADITAFSGSIALKRLRPMEYDVGQALERLRQHIENCANGELETFTTISTGGIDGKITIQARFNSWDRTKQVHDSLVDQRFPYIANSTFMLRLPFPHHYTITIPAEQYRAQKRRWNSLIESTKDNKSCNLWISPRGKVYTIRVLGEDKKAVGSLKVRAESLASGEKIESWHRSLAHRAGSQFLNSVFEATGAFVRHDWKLRSLKVYGDQDAVHKARAMVESEVERLASLEWTVFLKRPSVRFFVRQGLSALKETLGEDSVTLDLSSTPCKITIRGGGEEGRYLVERLLEDSTSGLTAGQGTGTESKCPICYDDVSAPVQLGCGHVYCTACIRHFLTTASDTKLLPLACMGDEVKCGVPVPIPTVQKFLQLQQFNHLLEVTFMSHVEQHPQDFKYCTTPDCSQIYRCNNSTGPLFLHCPACLSAVCASCHEEAHEGMGCAKDLAEQERLNEDWAKQHGAKKCPSCKVWIEKIDGCNHMACKCGAHICWKCMGIFTQAEIYSHMGTTHGGYGGGPEDIQPEEYRVQEQLLARALQLRAAEENRVRHRDEELEYRRALENRVRQREADLALANRRREELRRATEAEEGIRRRRLQILDETRREVVRRLGSDEVAQQPQRQGWGCLIM